MKTVHVLQHVPHETLGSLEAFFAEARVAWRQMPLFSQPSHDLPWAWEDEVTAKMVDGWLDDPNNRRELSDLDYIDSTAIRHRLPAAIREMEILGQHVLSRFAGMCRQSGEKTAC